MNHRTKHINYILLTTAIILIACCMRAPFTGVGSILPLVQKELGLAGSAAGLITSIPLLTFGALSVFIGVAGKRYGAGRVMSLGLFLIVVGCVLRSSAGIPVLFGGSVIVGSGIVIGNVLLPAIIKDYYPTKNGLMTSVYTTMQSVMSGIAGAASVPVAGIFGWRGALGMWAILAGISLALWLPFRKMKLGQGVAGTDGGSGGLRLSNTETGESSGTLTMKGLAQNPMAWAIALFMGLQSGIYYSFVSWFATILQSRGCDMTLAGIYNSAFLFLGLAGSFAAPLLGELRESKRWLGILIPVCYATGILIFTLFQSPASVWLVILICGLCQGAAYSYAMSMFAFHTKCGPDASMLSGFVQSVGYIIAGVFPSLFGWFYDAVGMWEPILGGLVFVAAILVWLGAMIGKPEVLE